MSIIRSGGDIPAGQCELCRISPLTKEANVMRLPVPAQTLHAFFRGEIPGLIQDALPTLSAAEREFVKTGYTQADWDVMFPPEPDEED